MDVKLIESYADYEDVIFSGESLERLKTPTSTTAALSNAHCSPCNLCAVAFVIAYLWGVI